MEKNNICVVLIFLFIFVSDLLLLLACMSSLLPSARCNDIKGNFATASLMIDRGEKQIRIYLVGKRVCLTNDCVVR